MLKLLPLFSLVFLLVACGEEKTSTTAETPTPTSDPDAIAREALAIYKQSPAAALPKFIEAGKLYQAKKMNEQAASAYFTAALTYEEQVGNLDSALYFAEESLERWQVSNKTMQIANLQNYTGLLMAKTGATSEGLDNVKMAVTSYQMLNFPEGEKLAQFNQAQVHFYQKKYDLSVQFFDHVQAFWKEKGMNKRLFENNLFGIELYRTTGDAAKVTALIEENKALLPKLVQAEKLIERFETMLK